MIRRDQIQGIVNKEFQGTDKFLVDILIKPGNKIFVFIDSDRELTIQDCRLLSRVIENSLDREKEDFELNVSSPGVEKPLKLLRQYTKNIGRNVKISLIDESIMRGELVRVDKNQLEIKEEINRPGKKGKKKIQIGDNQISIPFNKIKETTILVSYK